MPKRGRNRGAPSGFRYVVETPEERDERVAKRVYRFVYRLQCETCGQRIWGSGIAVGTHSRSKRHEEAYEASLIECSVCKQRMSPRHFPTLPEGMSEAPARCFECGEEALKNWAPDEHGARAHYHVTAKDTGAVFPVFFFTGESFREVNDRTTT